MSYFLSKMRYFSLINAIINQLTMIDTPDLQNVYAVHKLLLFWDYIYFAMLFSLNADRWLLSDTCLSKTSNDPHVVSWCVVNKVHFVRARIIDVVCTVLVYTILISF